METLGNLGVILIMVGLAALAIRHREEVKDWLNGVDRGSDNPRIVDPELVRLKQVVADARKAVQERMKIVEAKQEAADAQDYLDKLEKKK